MSYNYRIDSKYAKGKHSYIEGIVVDFFKRQIGYDINEHSTTDKPLHGTDFVIYEEQKLIEIAEIKTNDETKNCSSWISWHSPNTKSGDDAIKRFSDNFYNLDKQTQCFVVAIGVQIMDYLKTVNLSQAWLVQENVKYKESINKACTGLRDIENHISNFSLYLFGGMVFVNFSK